MMMSLLLALATNLSLLVHYSERPPYAARQPGDSEPVGLTATPLRQAAAAAGIRLQWIETPEERQLALLKANQQPFCGLGWFYRPQRLQLGRYSKALHQDGPQVVVARRDHPQLTGAISLEQLLSNPKLLMLRRSGYSYGAEADRLLTLHQTPYFTVSSPQQALGIMLAGGRGDYLLTNAEEGQWLIDDQSAGPRLQLLALKDGSPGETRHLLCSFATDPALLHRLDLQLPANLPAPRSPLASPASAEQPPPPRLNP
ncbi:MAG: hypothetical protein II007_11545 [Gammaproteobacteria bacterium]|nr:hypothetical protein [Gammaproteobacteria bacterium]